MECKSVERFSQGKRDFLQGRPIMIIIINIFIAQIPCEYDQMRVTNMIQIKHNRLRIPNWWEADQLGIYKAWRS